MDKLITVIVPVYNCEKYVKRAIESIELQPNSDKVEIIAVNDGSKDNSGAVLDNLAKQYENLKVFHKDNGGVSSARNFALKQATGKYVAFLDSDDWWSFEFLSDQTVEDLNKDFDVYQFGFTSINRNYKYKIYCNMNEGEFFYDKNSLGKYDYSYFCSFVYKRSIFTDNNIEFYPVKINEDITMVIRCLYFCRSLKKIDRSIFHYWANPASCMHTLNYDKRANEKFRSFEYLNQWMIDNGEKYDMDYDNVLLFNEIIRDVCAFNSYKNAKKYIEEDPRWASIKKYEEMYLTKRGKLTIQAWLSNPKKFHKKCKLFYRPKVWLKNFIYRHNSLSRIADYFFYKLKLKQQKANEEDVWIVNK